ncbi:hypothetical protein ACOJBM_35430 [Rhizobium beringeri]
MGFDLLVQWRIESLKDEKQIALINAFNLKASKIWTALEATVEGTLRNSLPAVVNYIGNRAEYADFRFPRSGDEKNILALPDWHQSVQTRPLLGLDQIFDSSKPQ